MPDAGLVAVDVNRTWLGGRYYLLHLVRCAEAVTAPHPPLRDVWWGEFGGADPFAEVRSILGPPALIRFPSAVAGRLARAVRRIGSGSRDAGDLFAQAGIDVLFPLPLCDRPGVPVVFWLPDFNYRLVPNYINGGDNGHERISRLVAAAKLVVLSSHDSETQFHKVFPQYSAKARVLHFCSVPDDNWTASDPARTAELNGLPAKFFLLSNQLSHHKNHWVLLEAIRVLKHRGIRTVVVLTGTPFGFRRDDFAREVQAFISDNGLAENIRMLGELPRQEYVALVRRSIALLQPSLFEGWSTPVEDAKALGKPVFVNRIPVFEEQLGIEYPFIVARNDPEAWADAMAAALRELSPGPQHDDEFRALSSLAGTKRSVGQTFLQILDEARGIPVRRYSGIATTAS